LFSRSEHLYDAVYSTFKDYGAEAERLHALIQDRSPGARTLLDVACGTGAHLARLAHWYDVEGVDLDPKMLEVAREKVPDVPLHVGDMTALDLGRRFDAVTCLFSSIGYAGSLERVHDAVAAMASHVEPGGVLVLEPWLSPDAWDPGRPHMITVDEPDLKIARLSATGRKGRISTLEFTYVVGTRDGVEVMKEHHEAVLLTADEYRGALEAAGLLAEHEPEGLMGRGLWIGLHPG
jgi:SAM-dependent methyltransferase